MSKNSTKILRIGVGGIGCFALTHTEENCRLPIRKKIRISSVWVNVTAWGFERDKVEEKNRFSMPPTPMNFKVCAVFFDIQF